MTVNAAPAPLLLATRLAVANHDAAAPELATRADPDAAAMTEAQGAIRNKDWVRADAIYARLLVNPRTNPAILYNNAAYVKIELGRAGDAVPLARKALEQAPDDVVAMETLGLALLRADGGGHDEALRLLQAAAKRQPGNPDIRAHLNEAGG